MLIKWDWLFVFVLVGLCVFPAMFKGMRDEPLWRRIIAALIMSGVISFFVSLPWL